MKSAEFFHECGRRGMPYTADEVRIFAVASGVPFIIVHIGGNLFNAGFRLDSKPSSEEKKAVKSALSAVGLKCHISGIFMNVRVKVAKGSDAATAVDTVLAGANKAIEIGRNNGIYFSDICPYCGHGNTDAVMCYEKSTDRFQLSYRAVHTECVNSLRNAANEAKVNDEGNYFTGIIGAIIGMILGVVLNVAVIFGTERIYAMLCALIPLGAFFGYKLLKGRMNSFAIVISIICSALGAVALTFGVDIADSMINYDYTFEEAILLIQYGMAEIPEYADAIRSSLLQDLLFVGLGVLCCIGVLRKNTNSGKAAYAGNLYATLRMKDGSLPAPAVNTVDDTASHGA